MAGAVLAVPLLGCLTISSRGLYSRWGVAPTWWCSIDVNAVHACSSKRPAAPFRCPGTSSPAVCRIRFSIVSLRCRLLSFCYIVDDMESRSQWQLSAKHNGTMRAHPDNRKMKVKKIFPHFTWGDHHYTPLYTAFGMAVAVPLQNTSCWRCNYRT